MKVQLGPEYVAVVSGGEKSERSLPLILDASSVMPPIQGPSSSLVTISSRGSWSEISTPAIQA
jgi:hypothetical protein